jgi:hypothetical protein
MPIEQDGKKYYDGDEINQIVRDRLAKESDKRALVVSERDSLSAELEALRPQVAGVEALTQQKADLEAQLAKANGQFSRYQAATTHGVTDPDTIEALEFAHQKAAAKLGDKAPDFATYLSNAATDESMLPSYLRGVLASGGDEGGEQTQTQQTQTQTQTQTQQTKRPGTKPPKKAPASNANDQFRTAVSQATTFEDLQKLQQERQAR